MLEDHSHSHPVYYSASLKQVERAYADQALMERAGRQAAEFVRARSAHGQPVLVLAGPGNNGGDALVAARCLREWGYPVAVVQPVQSNTAPPDAQSALSQWRAAGGTLLPQLPPTQDWGCVLDGLFGIGLTRNLEAPWQDLIQTVNGLSCPRIALDLPSGMDADTGCVRGIAIQAQHTLSFIALKPGLLTGDGVDYAGQVHLMPLGINAASAVAPDGWTLGQEAVARLLPPRKQNSNKGLYGKLGVIGGAPGMLGAAWLTGRAALKLGAGRVYVAQLDGNDAAIDPLQPELMWRPPAALQAMQDAGFVAGPGLGHGPEALALLASVVASRQPLLLDADALNAVARDRALQGQVRQRQAATVLTPHPLEAARLLGWETSQVQQDRIHAAQALAHRYGSVVVLKGAGSVIAQPDGRWWINPTGNAGLSSAGTGDVLSGMCGALLAQGLEALAALQLGVYLHGAAAEALAQQGVGPVGLTASELIDTARCLLNQWIGNAVGG